MVRRVEEIGFGRGIMTIGRTSALDPC